MSDGQSTKCELCATPGGAIVWQDGLCRVVRLDEPDYPGYCRVILNRHLREMTDLAPGERARVMEVVFAVEEAVRAALAPDKLNLASLGNVTPHLHWHVIPRYIDDRHFPNPIWGIPQRSTARAAPSGWKERLVSEITARLATGR
jgi:diadenosine tetraphosphate (Ap4A) HIT family hydrolase